MPFEHLSFEHLLAMETLGGSLVAAAHLSPTRLGVHSQHAATHQGLLQILLPGREQLLRSV